jgi:hypothetical protein
MLSKSVPVGRPLPELPTGAGLDAAAAGVVVVAAGAGASVVGAAGGGVVVVDGAAASLVGGGGVEVVVGVEEVEEVEVVEDEELEDQAGVGMTSRVMTCKALAYVTHTVLGAKDDEVTFAMGSLRWPQNV